jgi:hypothetical protein
MDPSANEKLGRRAMLGYFPPDWRRVEFDGGSCTIFAWPTGGGVVRKDVVDVVDMAFLGLDRFSPPSHCDPEKDHAKEDQFARKLIKTGGKFWRSESRYANVGVGQQKAEGEERMER